MEIPALFLAFLILIVEARGNEKRQTGPDCLQCIKVAEAHDCEVVTNCKTDEECFTEQYITQEGHIFFELGCKAKQICDAIQKFGKRSEGQPQSRQSDGRITLCEECCSIGSSCNAKGCDSYNSTKRMCYTCSGEQSVENPNDCETVTMCGAHEQCYQAYGLTNELELRYAMGCISDRACNMMYSSGGPSLGHPSLLSRPGRDVSQIYERDHLKRDMDDIHFKRQVRPDGSPMFTMTSCEYCCNNSYCNKNECINGVIRTAPPTTHAPTTPKTTHALTTIQHTNAPTTHAPIIALTTQKPTTHAPSTSTTHIFTTHAPTTHAPTITTKPTTHAPITAAPTLAFITHKLTTYAPMTHAPTVALTTPKHTTHAPITPAPTSTSTTLKQTTHAPTTPAPKTTSTTHKPTTHAPTTQSPTTKPTTPATTTTRVSTIRTTTSMPTTTLSTSTTTAPPSMMSMSTASTVTLTTSLASTTPQPSTICIVCNSSGCSNQACTGATPYCLNVLDNNADGNKQETRRCGSELECERDWYNVTALSDICSVYESWQLYALKFSCTYCCVRNYCNRDTNPPRETLYYPQRQ